MKRRLHRAASLAMAAFIASGCSFLRDSPREPDALVMPPVVLRIMNESNADIGVDVQSGEDWVKLGTVSIGRTTDFVLPGEVAQGGGVRFRVAPVGIERFYITQPIDAAPGDRIDWRVRNGNPALAAHVKKTT